jgi:hypothetical protein
MNSFAEFLALVFWALVLIGAIMIALVVIVACPWLVILVVLFILAYALLKK